MSEEKGNDKTCKVSVTYGRKVKTPISQYDNIMHEISIEMELPYRNSEDLDMKVGALSNKVRELNEKEISTTLSYIVEVSQDPNNEALAGSGLTLERRKNLQNIFGNQWKKVLFPDQDVVEIKTEEIVDLEDSGE